MKEEHVNSYMTSKFISKRPGSSARVYDDDNSSNAESPQRKSRIPIMPKRSYSLEGKGIVTKQNRISCHHQSVSMIPKPEWHKNCRKLPVTEYGYRRRGRTQPECDQMGTRSRDFRGYESPKNSKIEKKQMSQEIQRDVSPELHSNESFSTFKGNVLKIPEYWSYAGKSVADTLKNAVNIVAKQYPNANVDDFEAEIQNILKSTETTTAEIWSKTEDIISQAEKLYMDEEYPAEDSNEEILKNEKKSDDFRENIRVKKIVCGDLFKNKKEVEKSKDGKETPDKEDTKHSPHVGREKSFKMKDKIQSLSKLKKYTSVDSKKGEKNVMQSCGDIPRPKKNATFCKERITVEEKSTQTNNNWLYELTKKKDLTELNNQILELKQLCENHISKFKNFNLHIKLRGIFNKVQNVSVSKEIELLNNVNLELSEKNNQLQFHNRDLESAIKQRDMDIHQKNRLISQQKKLLQVRDELIEMLKSRCTIKMVDQ